MCDSRGKHGAFGTHVSATPEPERDPQKTFTKSFKSCQRQGKIRTQATNNSRIDTSDSITDYITHTITDSIAYDIIANGITDFKILITNADIEEGTTSDPSSRTEPEGSKNQESLSNTPRFPSFGSLAFNETCSWAINDNVNITANYSPGSNYTHCTLWAQPPPNHREGISDWLSLITSGFVMAKQTGCSLRIGYAQGVNLSTLSFPPE
ncbi:hypothetical protein MHU86_7714 [Fragilaria crotonensis]|nr:hypothetical protein MHU86_7714 [Fragilaria crotonensis]